MVDVGKSAIRSSAVFTQAIPSNADCRYSSGSRPFALAVTTKLYNMAEASAPLGVLQKSQALRLCGSLHNRNYAEFRNMLSIRFPRNECSVVTEYYPFEVAA